MELASKYDPQAVESKWYQYWLDNKLFSSKPDGREPYLHIDSGKTDYLQKCHHEERIVCGNVVEHTGNRKCHGHNPVSYTHLFFKISTRLFGKVKLSIWNSPSVGAVNPKSIFIVVDFPAPFGPRNP